MGGELFVDVIQYGWGILEEFIESLSRSGVVYIFCRYWKISYSMVT